MYAPQPRRLRYRSSILGRDDTRVLPGNASSGTAGRPIPVRFPNQPPHPPYSDTYVLPKTKYGLPVVPDMFADNLINSPAAAPEPEGRWWEATLKADRLHQRIQSLNTPAYSFSDEIPRSQRYFPKNEEELIAYETWMAKAKAHESAKAEKLRFMVARHKEDKVRDAECRLKKIEERILTEENVLETLSARDLVGTTGQEERVKMQCLIMALKREEILKKEFETKQSAWKQDPVERERITMEYRWKKQTAEYELGVLREEKARIMREQKQYDMAQAAAARKGAEKRFDIQMKLKKQQKHKGA